MSLSLKHISITTSNLERLVHFYKEVFGLRESTCVKSFEGDWLQKGIGVVAKIRVSHLGFEEGGSEIEIIEYDKSLTTEECLPNREGFSHIAFLVDDVDACVQRVLLFGGKKFGEISEKDFGGQALTFIYMRDSDGNIIELQNYRKK